MNQEATVMVSIEDGLFQGKIHVGDDAYAVEPASNYMDNSDAHSVIYKAKDLDYSSLGSGNGCGMIDQVQKRMEEKLKTLEEKEKSQEKKVNVKSPQKQQNKTKIHKRRNVCYVVFITG